jgi:capsular polysaccharide biosynthesis protein
VFWSHHSNAHLVTKSLALMFERKQICLESVYGYRRLRDDPAFRFLTLPKPVELSGNWTSIISRWVMIRTDRNPNYTHWLLDALPRMALLPEFPADTQIIVPARLHKNQEEMLRLMGIFDRCRGTLERHLQIENYYFSSPTTMLQGFSPYGIEFLRRTFLPKRDTSYHGPKKFFIQRLGLTREPVNRVEIERFFEKHGWQPINIMQLNFAQQVQLFAEAESITGMFGSAFTNSVFCQPGCKIFTIMPYDYGVDGFLEWIAQVVGSELRQMVIPGSYDYRFSVDLDAVKKELAACGMI